MSMTTLKITEGEQYWSMWYVLYAGMQTQQVILKVSYKGCCLKVDCRYDCYAPDSNFV